MPLFRRALELDPDFVPAIVALSITRLSQADFAEDADKAGLMAEAFALAERATTLDPNNPNALLQTACLRVNQEERRAEAWDHPSRAVELAPNNPDVLAVAAWCYPFGDHGRAPLDWAARAVKLNPGHPDWYDVSLAVAALFVGELGLARRVGRQAPPVSNVLVTMAAAEALLGNVEAARRWFDRFATETHFRSLSSFYYLEDMSRDPAWGPWIEGARLAGFPVTEAEADALAAQ